VAELHGVLLVDKPAGPTSQTVVTKVRRALGSDKAGHTGTLDPFATGLMVVCLGRATKLAGYLTVEDKEYRATLALGMATDTDDATGKEIARADASAITREALEAAIEKFRGPIRQVPPDFSAIQKDGERMYDRARRGEEVKIEPRDVVVHALTLVSFTPGAVASAEIDLHVSKGTYIRSIARDVGSALGVGGHLTALRRTAAGAFSVRDAIGLDAVAADPAAAASKLLALDRVPLPFESLAITAEEAAKVAHGIAPAGSARAAAGEGLRAVRGPDGALLAIATLRQGALRFERVI
jgi:tRNA pseudouridine55 synthase